MARKRTEWLQIGSGKSYLHRVHMPLQCLIFITPLLLFYQIASIIHPWNLEPGSNLQQAPQVAAFVLMLQFFRLFGVVGSYFPLLTVVAILLSWHFARKDPWVFEPRLYLGMFAESILWAIPIFVIGLAIWRHADPQPAPQPAAQAVLQAAAPAATQAGEPSRQEKVVLSIGAGVYEELLFRLVAITLLNILLVDAFEMKLALAIPIIIVSSAVMFSAYHYLGPEGSKPFVMSIFLFRTAMGIYLAGIYAYRGFGIVVGVHAAYDLILVGLTQQ